MSMAGCHISKEKGRNAADDDDDDEVEEEEEEEECISAESSHIPSLHSPAGKELQLSAAVTLMQNLSD